MALALSRSSSVRVSIEKKTNMSADTTNNEAAIRNGNKKGRCESEPTMTTNFSEDWHKTNEWSNILCVRKKATQNRTNKTRGYQSE